MVRAFGRSVWAATAAILWIAAACRDSAAPNTEPSYLLGELTGNIAVTAATTGSSLDPDGYTVTVDVITQSKSIPTNGSVTFTGVVPGVATVSISSVASNCTVSGGNLRVVTVPVGGTVSTTPIANPSAVAKRVLLRSRSSANMRSQPSSPSWISPSRWRPPPS